MSAGVLGSGDGLGDSRQRLREDDGQRCGVQQQACCDSLKAAPMQKATSSPARAPAQICRRIRRTSRFLVTSSSSLATETDSFFPGAIFLSTSPSTRPSRTAMMMACRERAGA